MALNRSLFNSPFLTINTSRFFRLSAFPSLISSDFSLLRVRKNDSASGIIFSVFSSVSVCFDVCFRRKSCLSN